MTLLAELFEQLSTTPEAGGSKQASAPAANDAMATPVAPQNEHAQNVAHMERTEGPPATRRNAWTITLGDRPVCTICGAPMTHTEALAEARWRWPDAEIE
jgi:hypothetical protein